MNKTDGWISLHRRIKESSIFMKPSEWFKVWVYILLEVNHQTGEGFFQWEFIERDCHITKETLKECLRFMEEESMIGREKLPRGVKITVQNWLDYQNKRRDFTPPSTPPSTPPTTPPTETEQEVSKEAEKQDKENFTPLTTPPSNSSSTPPPISTIISTNKKYNNKGLNTYTRRAKITFNDETFKFQNITEEKIQKWSEAFPGIDIGVELKEMEVWLVANPKNQKENYERFIVNWLSRTKKGGKDGKNKGNNGRYIPITGKRKFTGLDEKAGEW